MSGAYIRAAWNGDLGEKLIDCEKDSILDRGSLGAVFFCVLGFSFMKGRQGRHILFPGVPSCKNLPKQSKFVRSREEEQKEK